MPHPKKRERVSGDANMNNMIAVDDPLKEKAHPIFGDMVKYRPDIGHGGQLAVFGASRKRWDPVSKKMVRYTGFDDDKSHRGIDIEVPAGGQVKAPFSGTVSKINTFYTGDSKTKYVQVTTGDHVMRFAYVDPSVKEGDVIKAGDILGVMRRPTSKAACWNAGISDHVHIEAVKGNEWKSKDRIDPTELLGAVK